jgi:NitT/TauT family transport system ATP-binding protein
MVVKTVDVSKVFYSGSGKKQNEVVALRDVNFEIREREFVSIIGPSGCGKSTLLKIMSSLMEATSGEVQLNVEAGQENQPNIGFVFQDPVLLPWRTAIDNAMFPYEIMNQKSPEARSKVENLFSLAGLEGFEDAYPKQLSGGMKQRVAIVRALSYDPPILLMDEPFGAVDAITRDSLNNILLNIWRETRKTIVFVTHSISEAIYLSDRILVMSTHPGRIVDEVSIELDRPRSEDTKLSKEFYEYVNYLRGKLI